MKKIEAIIRPHKLEDVKQALSEAGVRGMTVTEVRGYGGQRGQVETYRGVEYAVDLTPRVKIEVLSPDDASARIVELIANSARTGEIGDGRIYVQRLAEVVRIRTGEAGDDAI